MQSIVYLIHMSTFLRAEYCEMPRKESICNSNASTANMSLVGWVPVLNYCYGLSDGAVDSTSEMEAMEPLL